MSEEKKVSADMADADFSRWLDAMGIDPSPDLMTETERKTYEKYKRRICAGISAGTVTVTDDGLLNLRTADGKDIEFPEPTGDAFMAMDGKGADRDVAKQYAVMGAMTKTSTKTFAGMKNRDLNICLAVTAIFLL